MSRLPFLPASTKLKFVRSIRWSRRNLSRKYHYWLVRIKTFRSEFRRSAKAFETFLKNCDIPENRSTDNPVGVVLMPVGWKGTPAPWHLIALGLGLARRDRNVIFIWCDRNFFIFPDFTYHIVRQNRIIGRILKRLSKDFQIIRLSREQRTPAQEGDEQHLDRLFELNMVMYNRGRHLASEPFPLRFDETDYKEQLAHNLALIRSLLRRMPFDYVIVPNGIHSSSGLFSLVTNDIGLRMVTADAGGPGAVAIAVDGIAGHSPGIPRAFNELLLSPPEIRQWAIETARQELQQRASGQDERQYQLTPALKTGSDQKIDILVPLNSYHDTAGLGKHHLFADTIDWLVQTISFVSQNSDKIVTIRQHPVERFDYGASWFDLTTILDERLGQSATYRFIAAAESVNTYDLLTATSLVLVHTSTVGIEAAALGRPVLAAGDSYYANLGFVYAAGSRQEYFDLLQQGMQGQLAVLPAQQEKAYIGYYLRSCNQIWTDFTPDMPEFWKWSKRFPEELFADPVVTDILDAIDHNQPIALLRHHRRLAEQDQTVRPIGKAHLA